MKNGYLMLARRTFDHCLWSEKRTLSKFEAWLDLLQLAAFLPTRRIIRGHVIEIGRGELVASLRYLGERWNWKKDKVASFLGLIEQDQMVRRSTRHTETIITLCNYERYNGDQDTEPDSKPDTRPTRTRQTADKVEEGKEGKEVSLSGEGEGELPGMPPPNPEPPRCLPKGWQKLSAPQKAQTRVNFNTPTMQQLGATHGRRATTLWTVAEAEALLRVKPNEDEIAVMIEFYEAIIPDPDRNDRRRHDMITLLNNWNGELDKARIWKSTRRQRQSA